MEHADKQLVSLASELMDFSLINPLNVDEEREKFFLQTNYNPIFVYKKYDANPALKALSLLELPADEFLPIRSKCKDFLIEYARALQKLGTSQFNVTIYGLPNKELLAYAHNILHDAQITSRQLVQMSATTAADELRLYLQKAGLTSWKVHLDSESQSGMWVNPAARTLNIRSDVRITGKQLKKLIVHEIETHAFRAANGRRQKAAVLATTTLPGALHIEEGLAGYNEELAGVSSPQVLRIKALRTLAVDMAAKGSFCDVFQLMSQYVSKKKAFDIAVRAKRGLGATNGPGGFHKGHVYLEGYLRVKEYALNGGDLKLLYAGKISLEELPLVGSLLLPGKFFPSFLPYQE